MSERLRRAVALLVLMGLSGCSLGRWRDPAASTSIPTDHLLAAARTFERQGKPEKSLELYAHVLATDPRNVAARDRVEAIVLAERRHRQEAATLAARNAAPSPAANAASSVGQAFQPAIPREAVLFASQAGKPAPHSFANLTANLSEPAIAIPMQVVDAPPLNTATTWASVPEIPMQPMTDRAAAPSGDEIAWAMPVAASASDSISSAEWHGPTSASEAEFADRPIEWKLPVVHVSAGGSSGMAE